MNQVKEFSDQQEAYHQERLRLEREVYHYAEVIRGYPTKENSEALSKASVALVEHAAKEEDVYLNLTRAKANAYDDLKTGIEKSMAIMQDTKYVKAYEYLGQLIGARNGDD